MAVSRTLRFQILRRDNYTCQSCGRTAPEVKLQVDHVVPEALGGRTEPGNLRTLCADCNGGKSATPPDAATVARVAADADRWAAAQQLASSRLLADRTARNDFHQQFVTHWSDWEDRIGEDCPFDRGWQRSIDTLLAQGIPVETLLDCVDKAMSSKRPTAENRFKYMCGIAWSIVRDLRDATAEIAAGAPAPLRPQIDVQWMLANWEALPATVRDVAEVPAWRDGRNQFTQYILDGFTEEQSARYMRLGAAQASADGDENADEADLRVYAIHAAINDMESEIACLSGAVDALTDILSSEQSHRAFVQAHDGLTALGGGELADVRVQAKAVRIVAEEMALTFVNGLDESDRMDLLRRVEERSPGLSDRELAYEVALVARAREAFGFPLSDVEETQR